MNAAKEAFSEYLTGTNLDSRQIYFVNQIVEYIVHNGMMKDLSVLLESPFPSAILFHVCGDRDPFRCTSRGRQGPCADAAHLRRSLSDPYCVDVRCISGTSGDQYDHAELPGILGHHGSFVHYLLFQKISKSKKRTGVRL